jgi:DNA alkylation damage repair protein AlkB
MPRTGKPLSVRMSNCGPLGWVADTSGYRYQAKHPVTGKPWPPIPTLLMDLWAAVAPDAAEPQACLINWYQPDAKMGLHQDRDEQAFDAPVVSVSLGDDALFRLGGPNVAAKPKAFALHPATSLCSVAQRGSLITACHGFILAPPRFWSRRAASTSPCDGCSHDHRPQPHDLHRL